MEFRLIYRNILPAQPAEDRKSRTAEKHAIRKYLHPQLKELWHTHPVLRSYTIPGSWTKSLYAPHAPGEQITHLDMIANSYTASDFHFVPLINNTWGTACSLEILFLRRDVPGNLIASGGDIDNRIKVLFDGLKMPKIGEIGSSTPTR